ncbi:protein kinase pinoid [Quercus suber]|uniref:non-specific serine/threonine protein kinase n=1 Tax=Quercus suber TaxID=58331 RepID=A0AAW0ITN6_QUESU|nr:protein kinase pinoid [Quercus suber]
MLSNFDLSLCSDAIPAVKSPSCSLDTATPSTPSYTRGAHMPFSCLPNWLFRPSKVQTLAPNRLFRAEPVEARSCSFIETHEYVSSEVASGGSHGSAVNWWAFGIFIYEMIYGRTPFAAPSNKTTLLNIIKKPLEFLTSPTPPSASELHAHNLISGLLNKEPVDISGAN